MRNSISIRSIKHSSHGRPPENYVIKRFPILEFSTYLLICYYKVANGIQSNFRLDWYCFDTFNSIRLQSVQLIGWLNWNRHTLYIVYVMHCIERPSLNLHHIQCQTKDVRSFCGVLYIVYFTLVCVYTVKYSDCNFSGE